MRPYPPSLLGMMARGGGGGAGRLRRMVNRLDPARFGQVSICYEGCGSMWPLSLNVFVTLRLIGTNASVSWPSSEIYHSKQSIHAERESLAVCVPA